MDLSELEFKYAIIKNKDYHFCKLRFVILFPRNLFKFISIIILPNNLITFNSNNCVIQSFFQCVQCP